MDASIFDSALSHTRRSDASEKKEENSVSTFGRFRLWTSLESSLVSVRTENKFLKNVFRFFQALLLSSVVYVLVMETLGHKETRFLHPMLPVLTIGAAHLSQTAKIIPVFLVISSIVTSYSDLKSFKIDRVESNQILKRHFCENIEENVQFYTPDCYFIAGEYSKLCSNNEIISENIIKCPEPTDKNPEVSAKYRKLIQDGTGVYALNEIGELMPNFLFINLIGEESQVINEILSIGYR